MSNNSEGQLGRIIVLLRVLIMLVVGGAIIVGICLYIQSDLDKAQKKMDDAVKFMQRGK